MAKRKYRQALELHQELCDIQNKRQKVINKLDKRRTTGLLKAHANLQQQEWQVHNNITQAILKVAKPACNALAYVLLLQLPREVRDIIYEYCWAGIGDVCVDRQLFGWDIPCTPPFCTCFDWENMYLWVLPAWVGRQVALEAAEVFYRIAHYRRLPVEQLENFLFDDRFHLIQSTPADHLRRVEVEINVKKSKRYLEDLEVVDRVGDAGLEVIKRSFNNLALVRLKQGFDLRIKLSYGCDDRRVERVLEALRTVLRELEKEGMQITIRACIRGAYRMNLMEYYDMSRDEWRKKWRLTSKKRDDKDSDLSSSDFDESSDSESSSLSESSDSESDTSDSDDDGLPSSSASSEDDISAA